MESATSHCLYLIGGALTLSWVVLLWKKAPRVHIAQVAAIAAITLMSTGKISDLSSSFPLLEGERNVCSEASVESCSRCPACVSRFPAGASKTHQQLSRAEPQLRHQSSRSAQAQGHPADMRRCVGPCLQILRRPLISQRSAVHLHMTCFHCCCWNIYNPRWCSISMTWVAAEVAGLKRLCA